MRKFQQQAVNFDTEFRCRVAKRIANGGSLDSSRFQVKIHFTTITGQCAYFTTPKATLPNKSLVKPDLPLVPRTIKSTISFSAKPTIPPTVERDPIRSIHGHDYAVTSSLIILKQGILGF